MTVPEREATYSIVMRLRRTTAEYAFVNVPVVGDLVRSDEKGVGRIDVTLMTKKAVEMGQEPEVVWYREEQRLEPHPVQKAPEPGESRYPA